MNIIKKIIKSSEVLVENASVGKVYLKDGIYYMCIEVGPNKKDMLIIGGNVAEIMTGRRTANIGGLYVPVSEAEIHV